MGSGRVICREDVGLLAKQRKKTRQSGGKTRGSRSGSRSAKAGAKRSAGSGGARGASKKKTTRKTAPARKAAKKKSVASKASKKKPVVKKSGAKKSGKGSKTKTSKKVTKKAAGKETSKKVVAKKTAAKKKSEAASGESGGKKTSPSASKKTSKKTQSKASGAQAADSSKTNRKGITIVSPKRGRYGSSSKGPTVIPKVGTALLGPGSPPRKPLIPSGPSVDQADTEGAGASQPSKPKLSKRDIERFRKILLAKRAELVGDLSTIEDEALRSQSGGLSHLPQHMAEQGSDASDQSLSLDLAAADRRLIKEIDDALGRIAAGTYGVCEVTGEPIRKERLEELPWARLSIQAARDLERRGR